MPRQAPSEERRGQDSKDRVLSPTRSGSKWRGLKARSSRAAWAPAWMHPSGLAAVPLQEVRHRHRGAPDQRDDSRRTSRRGVRRRAAARHAVRRERPGWNPKQRGHRTHVPNHAGSMAASPGRRPHALLRRLTGQSLGQTSRTPARTAAARPVLKGAHGAVRATALLHKVSRALGECETYQHRLGGRHTRPPGPWTSAADTCGGRLCPEPSRGQPTDC